jgi:hypothetical protein
MDSFGRRYNMFRSFATIIPTCPVGVRITPRRKEFRAPKRVAWFQATANDFFHQFIRTKTHVDALEAILPAERLSRLYESAISLANLMLL